MQDLFVAVDRALLARRQYGDTHPETIRRLDRAFSVCASSLMQCEDGLCWNITPYSFVAGETTLWEPNAPFDQVPYQLFADGVRMLGLLPGLTEAEFQRLLRLLTLDRATEIAPEDDTVTLFWEANFEHVLYQAIDSFEEGDQEARAKFARDKAQVIAVAQLDTSMLVEECWAGRLPRPEGTALEAKRRQLASLIGRTEAIDSASAAQALSLEDGAPAEQLRTAAKDLVQVQEQSLLMLAARLNLDTAATGERFVWAVAHAFRAATERDNPARITAPIRAAVDGLATQKPDMALEMISALCAAVGDKLERDEAERYRAALAGGIVSRKTLEGILAGASRDGADRDFYVRGLHMVLGYLDDGPLHVVLAALPAARDELLLGELIAYLQRVGQGHEAELAQLFTDADQEVGLALIRVLAEIPGPAARDAIVRASQSPHPVVRIAALGHVEGASSERLRLELRALLQDRAADVRVAALQAMQRHSIRAAGPFLVLLVRDSKFDAWPEQERRQALATLATLAPSRAEAVCLELLGDAKLLGSPAHDKTREAAAEALGTLASSPETLAALEKASSSRWRSSEPLRRACQLALETAKARFAAGKAVRAKERKP